MSREGDLMRRELKQHVLPALAALGFGGKGSSFQRKREVLDLLDIQYSKYGGELVLEFGHMPLGDLVTSWGAVVPEHRIGVPHLKAPHRARLEQRGDATGPHLRGFHYAHFGEDRARFEALARQIAALLPQVDHWLRTEEAGSHISPFGKPRA